MLGSFPFLSILLFLLASMLLISVMSFHMTSLTQLTMGTTELSSVSSTANLHFFSLASYF